MRKKRVIIFFVLIIGLIAGTFVIVHYYSGQHGNVSKEKAIYYCPMHPNFTSDRPGDCAICGMKLVKMEAEGQKGTSAGEEHKGHQMKENKILYYRHPMRPDVTSPTPKKDEMGMDYVPVYEEAGESPTKGIYISSERQQLIGVKTASVKRRQLQRSIRTAGRVAYDPELYIAQQEYIEVQKTQGKFLESTSEMVKEQAKTILNAAERKLLLMGMSQEQIQELAAEGKPQENLYLPLDSEKVWIYATIYEFEIGLLKKGLPVKIESVAYPGETFHGTVKAVAPVLEAMTRSLNVRIEADNTEGKLKPEMYVDVDIQVDLGKKLVVPEEAVMDSGVRWIVFIAKPEGYFETRQVKVGQKGEGYYEIVSGVREGEKVVVSGNFLVDSESKLKEAISSGSEEGHQHGQ